MPTVSSTSPAGTPREIVTKMMDAWRHADLQGIAALLHDDCVWEVMTGGSELMPDGARYVGKKKIADELLPAVPKFYYMETLQIHERATYVDGPMAIVEFQTWGKARTGRINDGACYCWVFKIEDGKVVELREYIDSLKLQAVFAP